jgi:hypothetical protein
LKDTADYIMKLPKAEQILKKWQAATETLIMAAEGRGPVMHARIGVMRALNLGHVREFNTSRKEPHWGRRKLKRDQWRMHVEHRERSAFHGQARRPRTLRGMSWFGSSHWNFAPSLLQRTRLIRL